MGREKRYTNIFNLPSFTDLFFPYILVQFKSKFRARIGKVYIFFYVLGELIHFLVELVPKKEFIFVSS